MGKGLIFVLMIFCCIGCFDRADNANVAKQEEKILLNMAIDSLKEKGGISKVFGQFNFMVDESVLKGVFKAVDSTLTASKLDSLCGEYYYKSSMSIHNFINDKNEELIVYRFPEKNISVIGFPIFIGKRSAVTINHHHKFLRPHLYELHAVALVFERKNSAWRVSENIIINVEE